MEKLPSGVSTTSVIVSQHPLKKPSSQDPRISVNLNSTTIESPEVSIPEEYQAFQDVFRQNFHLISHGSALSSWYLVPHCPKVKSILCRSWSRRRWMSTSWRHSSKGSFNHLHPLLLASSWQRRMEACGRASTKGFSLIKPLSLSFSPGLSSPGTTERHSHLLQAGLAQLLQSYPNTEGRRVENCFHHTIRAL